MKKLWTYIDSKSWSAHKKYQVAVTVFSLIYALAGLLLWAVVSIFTLNQIQWMFCFMGYPLFISWVVVFFYAGKHGFHQGPHKKADYAAL